MLPGHPLARSPAPSKSPHGDAHRPPLNVANRSLGDAQPVVPYRQRSQRFVSLSFEGDEESAQVRSAFVLGWVDRFLLRGIQATSDEIWQECAIDERVQVIPKPRVVDEHLVRRASGQLLLQRQPNQERVRQSTGEVPPVGFASYDRPVLVTLRSNCSHDRHGRWRTSSADAGSG